MTTKTQITFDSSVHKAAKIQSIGKGITLSEFVNDSVRDRIAALLKRKAPKKGAAQ